ncbi:FAD-dependent oxidoreductase [Oceanospirillum beijerinckii]|uniref:oxidoreductase n=1 Tax=Oceanospirillum beijerinckii TaxID=64976 RepID=UPI0003FD4689|nr:FAD-dependent oxidoreductase [Oceanospirillum beijerinckii]
MAQHQHLLQPGKIGSLELKNRMIMAPMGSNFAETDGHCGERIQAFYEERAKGGAGLLTMGVCSIAYPNGTAEPYQVGVSDDKFLPGLTKLVERVHAQGGKIAMQLQHAGKTAVRDIAEGRELWVPSMPPAHKSDMMKSLTQEELGAFIRSAGGEVKIHVMDKTDIEQMVVWFAAAAERAKRAGFDGIELHAAHTYILAGFLSAYYNKRDDEYGGSLENRARLLMEVIAAVRARVGEDYPLWLRIDAQELRTPGGITLDDAIAVAKMAEQAGLDAVHVSAYANPSSGAAFTEAPLVQKAAGFLDWAAEIKQHVSIPVTAVGKLEPDVADKAIADGKCDFVAMGRKLLADPELPKKLTEGRPEDIRPCIYCYVCVSQIFVNDRVKCAVNPFTGHESELKLIATDQAKHVVVVGGGPGGMEAARVAAQRGHKVTLSEKGKRLGGTLFFASLAYQENGALLDYLTTQLEKSNVDVRLNTLATVELLKELKADEVILATGALRNAPNIPGADQKHVWSGDELRRLMTGEGEDIAKRKLSVTQRMMMKSGSLVGVTNSTDAMQHLSKLWMPLGKEVTIVGGGLVGLELAEFLVERGRKVTVLEPTRDLGKELAIVRRWRVLDNLEQHDVTVKQLATVTNIDKKAVHYTDKEGNSHSIASESVVLALGAETDTSFADAVSQAGFKVTNIGDSAEVAYIEGALKTGLIAGLEV